MNTKALPLGVIHFWMFAFIFVLPLKANAFEVYRFDSLEQHPTIIKVYVTDCMIRGGVPMLFGDMKAYFSPLVRSYPKKLTTFTPEFTSEWSHSLDFDSSRCVQLTTEIPWF